MDKHFFGPVELEKLCQSDECIVNDSHFFHKIIYQIRDRLFVPKRLVFVRRKGCYIVQSPMGPLIRRKIFDHVSYVCEKQIITEATNASEDSPNRLVMHAAAVVYT